ncbi:hypothetical protein BKA64DRAFT_194772 [Cadophora sp. MPI-SDFR-AT-0126]|nr:hypothetical protein BKA64DRAFT_194772 [Leotiomycetes sp. MPI-SDFR-AT-0126]
MFPYASNTLVPAMLHVCFEARKVGMKFYKQINHYASENDDTTSIGRTFVNFNVDIILLETADTVKRFDNSTPKWGVALQGKNIITENCKLLAVVCKEARTLPERLKSPVRMNFDKLRTLYVVDKYTQHMGDSKTGNLSIVDMPEGSREQGFTHFQLEVQELRKDFVYVKMKNPLLMKAVEAVRDNHKSESPNPTRIPDDLSTLSCLVEKKSEE